MCDSENFRSCSSGRCFVHALSGRCLAHVSIVTTEATEKRSLMQTFFHFNLSIQLQLLKSIDGLDVEWCKEVKGNIFIFYFL